MRHVPALLTCVSLTVTLACRPADERSEHPVDQPPRDPFFTEFQKNWRQVVSPAPELALPVVKPDQPQAQPWTPRVVVECVFSADAGGLVPQATLSWIQPAAQVPDILLAAREQRPPQLPLARIDLALHYDGFGRNRFATALSSDSRQRFRLAASSALAADEPAVLLTGPGLFPRLVEHTVVAAEDRDTRQPFARETLVLQDLNHGASYTIRVARAATNRWLEDGRFMFLTPVCPTSF